MEGDRVSGSYVDPRLAKTPLSFVAEEWFATNPARKEQTRIGYRQLLDNHVLPALGDEPVGRITKARLRTFIAELADKGAAPGTIRNVMRNTVKPLMDLAVEHRYVLANPALGIRLPASDRKEMLFLTADEVAVLADTITPAYRELVHFASYVGARASEIGALRTKHLNLMRGTATIAESVTATKGRGLVYGPTKTYAIRTVTIPRPLIDPLAAYIATRASDPEAFVFVTEYNRPLRHGNFMADHFRPAVERAFHGKPRLLPLRFHDLRHTAASLMIALNANPKTVMQRMGHSSIAVTFDRYGHLLDGHDEELAAALGEVYRSASSGSRPEALAPVLS